jgi:Carboxypeptidase regulatory-like domain/TonB dependent receptor
MNPISRLLKICLLISILGGASASIGQSTGAQLTGQITDDTGAGIPGAHVSAQNTDTNLTQSAESNGQGIYVIHFLPPGPYRVTVEQAGFEREIQNGIVLTVNQTATLNIPLHPGAVKQTVNVAANAELINTSSAEISTMVNAKAVVGLPLNGRDPSSLVFLAPGVTNVKNEAGTYITGPVFPTETGASVNGGRQGSVFYLLDGVSNIDDYNMLTAPFPNADATQEFRVISNNFDARYGFAPSAVVSVETKSGSNRFHGVVFEFLRNRDLNASNYFSHVVDPLRRNQFGGGVGGPILKDKLFFFANYQGTRASSATSGNVIYTPTSAMLQGDFSAIPLTLRAPFATVDGKPNQINPTLFSPAAVTIADTALPLGQAANGAVLFTSAPTINNYNEVTDRLDYTLSDKHRLMVRSFINYFVEPQSATNGNILTVVNGQHAEDYNAAFNHTWTINPSTINVVSLFWTQISGHTHATSPDINGDDVCLHRYINVVDAPYAGGQCFISGFSVTGAFTTASFNPAQELRTTYGIYETFTKTINKHTLSVGTNLQHESAVNIGAFPGNAGVTFNGSYTGLGLADFLLGDLYSFSQGAGQIADLSGWRLGLFAQDEFRIKPNLTITAGLRWDPNTPPSSAAGWGDGFNPGQTSTVYPNAPTGMIFPGDKGLNSGLMPTTYNYWEPRLGFAWQPKSLQHTSIRAAFGTFTAPLMYVMYNHMALSAPFSPTYSFNGTKTTPLSFANPWASYPGTGGANPFPPFVTIGVRPPSNYVFLKPVTISGAFANNFHLGVTQSWNASIQQEFGHNVSLQIAYVGSETYHQSTALDQNAGIFASGGARTTYSNFGAILTNFSNGTANYQGLQVTVDKRLSDNLQFQSNFTWSKAIDTVATGNISVGGSLLPDPFDLRWNRGVSALNVPLIWISNLVYTTPSLSGKNWLMRTALGSWGVSAIVTSQSGTPITILGGNGNNNSLAQQSEDRANVVPGQTFHVRQGGKSQWIKEYFNTSAFTSNPPGTFGNSAKNPLVGPPINTTDMGIMKNFSITEAVRLQFRWEMFNAFNHPDMGVPGNIFGASGFGQITSIGFIPPRVGQAALKLEF